MNDDLIRRSALLDDGIRVRGGINENGLLYVPLADVRRSIKEAPAVDAVEVVRCKDCKYRKPISPLASSCHGYFCSVWDVDDYEEAVVNDDDFCSRGERRST